MQYYDDQRVKRNLTVFGTEAHAPQLFSFDWVWWTSDKLDNFFFFFGGTPAKVLHFLTTNGEEHIKTYDSSTPSTNQLVFSDMQSQLNTIFFQWLLFVVAMFAPLSIIFAHCCCKTIEFCRVFSSWWRLGALCTSKVCPEFHWIFQINSESRSKCS